MFLTFHTKRGFRACNVSAIARLDYRSEPASLEITLRGITEATAENQLSVLRLKGEQARRGWRLLDEKGLLWLGDPSSPAGAAEALEPAEPLERDEDQE